MSGDKLPIIAQLHNAVDDRERARILLQCPDAVLMKYREVFEAACRRAQFELGEQYIAWRRAGWHAVRNAEGRLPDDHEDVRKAFAAFADGRAG